RKQWPFSFFCPTVANRPNRAGAGRNRRRLLLDAGERQPVHADPAVAYDPVQVRPGHAPGRADLSDLLPGLDRVALGDRHLAEVEVRGHESGAVVDVDDVPAEEELVDDAHDAAGGRVDRRADGSGEVDARVAALDLAVELPAVAEAARDAAGPRTDEGRLPQARRAVRPAGDLADALGLAADPRQRRLVVAAAVAGRDGQPLVPEVAGRDLDPLLAPLDAAGGRVQLEAERQLALGVDGDGREGGEGDVAWLEVQRLAGELARNAHQLRAVRDHAHGEDGALHRLLGEQFDAGDRGNDCPTDRRED